MDAPLPAHVAVLVVGAGPTGLALAGELGLRGTDCLVVDRLAKRSTASRSLVLHARTLEYLDVRGLLGAFLAQGHPYEGYPVGGRRPLVGLTRLGLSHPAIIALPQHATESLLARRVAALGVPVLRGAALVALDQDDTGVTATLEQAGRRRTVRAGYVVGCDGPKSTVRSAVGVGFPGEVYPDYVTSADVRLNGPTPSQPWARFTGRGMVILLPFGDGRWRVILYDYSSARLGDGTATIEDLRAMLRRVVGTDFAAADPTWLSRYRCEQRHADAYRRGRVLLAGDAAHLHAPTGGQGLNTGFGDAMNLGWKLARVAEGAAPRLLDTYEQERRRSNRGVLAGTGALLRFNTARRPPARLLRWLALNLVAPTRPAQHWLSHRLSGLAVGYRAAGAAPVGTRMPDLVAARPGRPARLFEALRTGEFVLATRDAAPAGTVSLPGLVTVTTPGLARPAVLVRPDGYVAWASRTSESVTGAEAAAALAHASGLAGSPLPGH